MSELPPEVLGRMGPLLCWVEGAEGLRLPLAWIADHIPVQVREQAWLVREFPTYSYDTVDDIVNLTRKQGTRIGRGPVSRRHLRAVAPPAGYDLMAELDHLGERYFRWQGNELTVREHRMIEIHELALRFPVRHLIRHCHSRAVVGGSLEAERALALSDSLGQLHTTGRSLRAVVERGVSEGHLHLWGVLSGDESWADHILRPLSRSILKEFKAEEERLLILGRAAVRMLALGLLAAHVGPAGGLPFRMIPHLDRLYHAGARVEGQRIRLRLREALKQELRKLTQQRLPAVSEDVLWLLRVIDPTAYGLRYFGQRPADTVRQRIALLDRLHFAVQIALLRHDTALAGKRSLSHSASRWSALLRQYLHQVFFRYLVYHTHHWQQATQSGKTTGLRQFNRFFDAHQRKLRERTSLTEHGLILERLSRTQSLKVVEGRVSPPERGAIDLVPWVLGYADCRQRGQLHKFGLVIHFKKQEADPREGRRYYRSQRHGQIRRQTRAHAFQLYRLLRTPHPVVPFVVGIDAASLELSTPPEVFAPAFRFLREFPIELRRDPLLARFPHFAAIQALVADRQLGMTYHVGEDFRHLLSGLRAIHEVIEFLRPRPGDRLGHAIALALAPDTWAAQISYQALVPKLEWLDDLVWLHHLLGPGHDLIGDLEVEDTIQRLSREIYCARRPESPRCEVVSDLHLPPPTLYDAWRLRQLDPNSIDVHDLGAGHGAIIRRSHHGDQELRWARVQSRVLADVNRHVGSNDAFRLLGLYWYNLAVRATGDEIEPVDMQDQWKLWHQVCQEAQTKVQEMVQKRQLVVEVNPTINRVVGPMGRLADHHVFRMTLDEENRLRPGIRVTVNTDDPGVVGTSLMHEYYLLGEHLLKNDVPETQVEQWLEWLRKNGTDFSFLNVLPSSPEDPRYQDVLILLERLRQMYPNLARRVQGLPPRYRPKPSGRRRPARPPEGASESRER